MVPAAAPVSDVRVVVVPCLSDNYAYLVHRAGSASAIVVDASEAAPVREAAAREGLSIEAIFLSCFVLISQNRQAEKDRVRSDIEYDVNIKAELEVAHLHEKTDRLYAEMLERFIQLERILRK